MKKYILLFDFGHGTRNYTAGKHSPEYILVDGKKVYTSDVIVENLTFISNNPINAEGKEKDIVKDEEKNDPFKEFGEEVDIDSVLPF